MDFLSQIPPFALVLLASLFTWGLTMLGAAVVFCFKEINKKALDIMLGASSGIMVAAAIWSLMLPAAELANEIWQNQWLSPSLGFLIGGIFIILTALLLEHQMHSTHHHNKRKILLVSAITLHNIPEGLAVGVGFSSFATGTPSTSLIGALLIAFGIGIQNFPDGLAVSVPLYRDGVPKSKAFIIGQASGLVEPIAAIIGYWATVLVRGILPFLLSFAAGAMLAVVINELIPDINPENQILATLGFVCGFILLMILDITITI